MAETGRESIRVVAERLAEGNAETSPDLLAIYWFPDEEMIHLVMVDPVTLPNENERMLPFYFGPFREGEISYPYVIALIRPEEQPVLSPPPGWGDWSDAVQLWPKR